jgi:hypothetical protein
MKLFWTEIALYCCLALGLLVLGGVWCVFSRRTAGLHQVIGNLCSLWIRHEVDPHPLDEPAVGLWKLIKRRLSVPRISTTSVLSQDIQSSCPNIKREYV